MDDDFEVTEDEPKLTVYFNPFDGATIEENNERIRKGWEVMPIRIPREDR